MAIWWICYNWKHIQLQKQILNISSCTGRVVEYNNYKSAISHGEKWKRKSANTLVTCVIFGLETSLAMQGFNWSQLSPDCLNWLALPVNLQWSFCWSWKLAWVLEVSRNSKHDWYFSHFVTNKPDSLSVGLLRPPVKFPDRDLRSMQPRLDTAG